MTTTTDTSRTPDDPESLRAAVRERYAGAARVVLEGSGTASCCGPVECCGPTTSAATFGRAGDAISSNLYDAGQAADVPEEAILASLGCGNPTLLAQLQPGETVLDLGSGGGIDVLLSARRVGQTGFAYGLDMTDEMLAIAEQNRQRAGIDNVQFLKGTIEQVPLPDASIDVIISNCVINLSADKDAVLREAFRVLKPGGRFAVSDIVFTVPNVSDSVRRSLDTWSACIGGALTVDDYRAKLAASGFAAVSIEVSRAFTPEDGGDQVVQWAQTLPADEQRLASGALASAAVRARKPAR